MKLEDVDTWRRALLRFRERKDLLFRSDRDAPVGHREFAGLKYFDPDPEFRFETEPHRNTVPGDAIMTTSKGTRQLFNRVGHFELSIEGKAVRLQRIESSN